VQLWTAVASLVTAVATLLTVLEMRWQRHAGYRPDLLVTGEPLHMRGNAEGIRVEVVRESTEAATESYGPHRPAVLCSNVGIAHAKDVRIEWDYDILAFVAAIAALDNELGSSIVREQGMLHFDAGNRAITHMIAAQSKSNFASIAPGAPATRVDLPLAYVDLLCAYFGAWLDASRPREGTVQVRRIELTLTLRYRDIGNNEHSRRFIVVPDYFYMKSGLRAGAGVVAEVKGLFEVRGGA